MTWKPSYLTRKQMEKRRLEGGRLLKAGKMSKAEISRHLGVSRATVGQLARTLETKGMRGLQKRKAASSEPKLSNPQKQSLKKKLERGALANGYATDRWTLDRFQKLIKRECDVTYHPNYLNRLLHKLGFSPQKPMPQAIEQEKELVEAWLLGD